MWSCVVLVLLCGVLWPAGASDANWGVVVQCYRVKGSVLCPGCNQRGGLLCPRRTANAQTCNIVPKKISTTEVVDTSEPVEETSTISTIPTITSESSNETTAKDEEEKVSVEEKKDGDDLERKGLDTIETEDFKTVQKLSPPLVQNKVDLNDTLSYRYMTPRYRYMYQRYKREDGTCEWNGDCPCPLICCITEDGCSKKCRVGIRLPPPWG